MLRRLRAFRIIGNVRQNPQDRRPSAILLRVSYTPVLRYDRAYQGFTRCSLCLDQPSTTILITREGVSIPCNDDI